MMALPGQLATLVATARRPFNGSRGGHAPGYLRGEFANLVDLYVRDGSLTAGQHRTLHKLAGRLWNCTDAVPRDLRADLEELQGPQDALCSTYAQAARFVRYVMGREKPRIRVLAISRPLAA